MRHGTTNLFAALTVGTGEVFGELAEVAHVLDGDDDLEIERDALLELLFGLLRNDVEFVFGASISAIRAPAPTPRRIVDVTPGRCCTM